MASALAMREQGAERNELLDKLAADERMPLDRSQLDDLMADKLSFTGAAGAQISRVVSRIDEIAKQHPGRRRLRPRLNPLRPVVTNLRHSPTSDPSPTVVESTLTVPR